MGKEGKRRRERGRTEAKGRQRQGRTIEEGKGKAKERLSGYLYKERRGRKVEGTKELKYVRREEVREGKKGRRKYIGRKEREIAS